MIVIDGDGLILGRLASITAKKLLEGETIHIVNAENIMVSGRREMVLSEYLEKRRKGSKEKGPFYPKRPDMIVKRTVRGMLPYKQARGREALSRLRVYVGVPRELEDVERELVSSVGVERLSNARYVKLSEISRFIGGKF